MEVRLGDLCPGKASEGTPDSPFIVIVGEASILSRGKLITTSGLSRIGERLGEWIGEGRGEGCGEGLGEWCGEGIGEGCGEGCGE